MYVSVSLVYQKPWNVQFPSESKFIFFRFVRGWNGLISAHTKEKFEKTFVSSLWIYVCVNYHKENRPVSLSWMCVCACTQSSVCLVPNASSPNKRSFTPLLQACTPSVGYIHLFSTLSMPYTCPAVSSISLLPYVVWEFQLISINLNSFIILVSFLRVFGSIRYNINKYALDRVREYMSLPAYFSAHAHALCPTFPNHFYVCQQCLSNEQWVWARAYAAHSVLRSFPKNPFNFYFFVSSANSWYWQFEYTYLLNDFLLIIIVPKKSKKS